MRVALISDIHGNLPALKAVIAQLERERFDQLVCLGDVAVGPQPIETLRHIQALDCPVVMGNWDHYLLDGTPNIAGELRDVLTDICSWTAEELSSNDREYIAGFRRTVVLELGNETRLLAFHGSPRSDEDQIFATTSDQELDQMLFDHEATVFAGGHTHFQLLRRHAASVVVNAGSVGLPFRRRLRGVMQISPWAEYCVIAGGQDQLAVEFRRTPYDVEGFRQLMLGGGMPHAQRWAELFE